MINEHIDVISNHLITQKQSLISAESCTGGLVSYLLTERPGSSQWFERGLVTYSNQAKMDLLGVNLHSLEKYGAVSEQVAREMAAGCLNRYSLPKSNTTKIDYALSITGIAGPDGGSDDKPVGLVWFAWAIRVGSSAMAQSRASSDLVIISDSQQFSGDRHAVRQQAAEHSLQHLASLIQDYS